MKAIDITEKTKEQAYDLIRTIYKFIPTYNQIKGTYLGIQFVLRMMGLCASINELWGRRNDVVNFSTDATYYRESELNAVRRFINEVATGANINDYYLTSKFDVDLTDSNITFIEFNGMAETIVEVINSIRPVTRCLRKLWYMIKINTDIHFNYIMGVEPIYIDDQEPIDGSGIVTELDESFITPETDDRILSPERYNGSDSGGESESEGVSKYGMKIRTFHYIWKVLDNPQSYKVIYDRKLKQISRIFLPFNAIGAKLGKITDESDKDRLTNTMRNCYFNLFDLDIKLRKSQQKTFRFIVYAKQWSSTQILYNEFENFVIGKDVTFKMERNGIYIDFIGNARMAFSEFFNRLDFNETELLFATNFNIVLGSKYIYQDDIPLNVWEVEKYFRKMNGLIYEVAGTGNRPIFITNESTNEVIFRPETRFEN